jgi:hypothetical protein
MENAGWYVTASIDQAWRHGVFAECTVKARPLAREVARLSSGRAIPGWHQYYCGIPSDDLIERLQLAPRLVAALSALGDRIN